MDTTLILAAVGLMVAGGYVAACAFWPYQTCPRCHGNQRRKSPSGKYWRAKDCRRCKGAGVTLRAGRRIYNYWSK